MSTASNADAIIKKLFEPEERRVQRIVDELFLANKAIKGQDQIYGFMHMGKRYLPTQFQAMKPAMHKHLMPSLAFELLEQANAFQADVNKIEADKAQIRQAIVLLIEQTNGAQELRDALPDCIVNLFPQLASIKRMFQDFAWLIRSNPYAIASVEKALPKMEFYAATHLIY